MVFIFNDFDDVRHFLFSLLFLFVNRLRSLFHWFRGLFCRFCHCDQWLFNLDGTVGCNRLFDNGNQLLFIFKRNIFLACKMEYGEKKHEECDEYAPVLIDYLAQKLLCPCKVG